MTMKQWQNWGTLLPQYKRYELNSYAFLSPVSCREQRIDNRDIGSRNTIITIPAVGLLGAPSRSRTKNGGTTMLKKWCTWRCG